MIDVTLSDFMRPTTAGKLPPSALLMTSLWAVTPQLCSCCSVGADDTGMSCRVSTINPNLRAFPLTSGPPWAALLSGPAKRLQTHSPTLDITESADIGYW